MKVNNCPCCSESMLLHLSSRRSYWFCSHCRLEMPNPSVKGLHQDKTIEAKSIRTKIAPLKSNQPIAIA